MLTYAKLRLKRFSIFQPQQFQDNQTVVKNKKDNLSVLVPV